MTLSAISRAGVTVRLTDERWVHIAEEHCELAGMREEVVAAVSDADRVLAGSAGELLALRKMDDGKTLVVAYREIKTDDGFVITAFLTRRTGSLERRKQVWPEPS